MFKPIQIPSINELIFQQLIELIKEGKLKPNDRLPTADQMADAFVITKNQVKLALTRLEHFGIIIIKPQSGSYLANYSSDILIRLIENQLDVVDIKENDLKVLRYELESYAVRLLASQATEEKIKKLQLIHNQFALKVQAGERAVDEDFYFHLMMVKLAGNSALSAIYSYLAPSILNFWYRLEVKGYEVTHQRALITVKEHQDILNALFNNDLEASQKALNEHISNAHKILD